MRKKITQPVKFITIRVIDESPRVALSRSMHTLLAIG